MAHVRLFEVTILLIFCAVSVNSKEILIDEEGPVLKVDSHEEYPNENIEEAVEHAPCHMEYQVMKRVVGTCIKLGKTARGCVAGNYLHPLHPECM